MISSSRLTPRLMIAIGALGIATAAAGSAQAAAACPAGDFTGFFRAFANSTEVQRQFSATSVDFSAYEASDDTPDPVMVTRNRPREAIQYPVIPTTAQQRAEGLRTRFLAQSNGDQIVDLTKPDTDYQLRFVFNRVGACWELEAKIDQSL